MCLFVCLVARVFSCVFVWRVLCLCACWLCGLLDERLFRLRVCACFGVFVCVVVCAFACVWNVCLVYWHA